MVPRAQPPAVAAHSPASEQPPAAVAEQPPAVESDSDLAALQPPAAVAEQPSAAAADKSEADKASAQAAAESAPATQNAKKDEDVFMETLDVFDVDTAAAESASKTPTGETHVCYQCRVEKDESDMTKMRESRKEGVPASWICKLCNSALSRIKRLCNTNEFVAEGMKALTSAQRKATIQKCQHLFDDALAKVVTEEVQQVLIQRSTSQFSMGGDMKLVKDIQKLLDEETEEEEKTALIMLLDKGVRHKCQYTGREWIWEPKYAITKSKEEIQEQRQKRTIEQSSTIKKNKVMKRPAGARTKPEDGDEEPPRALKAPESKKLCKLQALYNKGMLGLEKALLEAEGKPDIPEKVATDAKNMAETIRSEKELIAKVLFENMASPTLVMYILEGGEQKQTQLAKATSRLEAFVESD